MSETSRSSESRDMQRAHEEESKPWVRGSSMEMPPARPGMDQRWIRFQNKDQPDTTNFSRKLREGWSPRKDKDIPEGFLPMRMEQGKYAGALVVQGSILCERPLVVSARRNNHFANENRRRTEALDADLDKVNRDNRSSAFGPVQKATQRQAVREVSVQKDGGEL